MGATGVYEEGGGRPAKFWRTESGGRTRLELWGWGWTFIFLAFNPDGKMLAITSVDDPAMIWDTETGKLFDTLTGHEDVTTTHSPVHLWERKALSESRCRLSQ